MPTIRNIKTNFTAGEVSHRLLGRGDLRAYENGARTLRNVFIHPTGGISRRQGLRFIDQIPAAGRLIDFEFNTEQTYLLCLTHNAIRIYLNDALIINLASPWSASQLTQIGWTQSADTLLIVHPDVSPKKLTRSGAGVWSLSDWAYDTDTTGAMRQPYFKFESSNVTLTPSGTSGSISLTASSAFFVSGHVGTRFRIQDKEVEITGVTSGTVATATTIQNLGSTTVTKDWQEAAFNAARGWPISAAFHQDRLVLGGSRDLPNRLWMSRSGGLWDFDLGTGLDDEAIEFAILSDQVNAIRHVFSGRHLQVFTSGAEWQVSGDPLTPKTVQLNRQTRVGSIVTRTVPPLDVDGATIFAARSGRELREFIYTDVEQAYQSNDLALVAQHIIKDPVDQTFDKKNRLLHLVLANGQLATLTAYRAEQVAAWTLQETQGQFTSITTVGDTVYALIKRANGYFIESFDEELWVDGALSGTVPTPALTWSGLGHLNGLSVSILADGIPQPDQVVSGGMVTLIAPANEVHIGLAYTHVVEPLPPSIVSEGGQAKAIRLLDVTFRVENTAALRIDTGQGFRDIPLNKFGYVQLDVPPMPVSQDIRVKALGWRRGSLGGLWRIEQSIPLPFTLLSVSTDLRVSE